MTTGKLLLTCLILALPGFAQAQAQPSAGPGWQVAGRLGLLQFVVVSGERIRQRAFYDEVIAARCPPDATCFVRFFTNSTGAPVALPLADAILAEPAASFQRSAKQSNEVFEWSCRLGLPGNCF
ncbi:MAG: hypothetical protein WCF44_22070 [Candidatus Methylophosphatis roskildensis]